MHASILHESEGADADDEWPGAGRKRETERRMPKRALNRECVLLLYRRERQKEECARG